MKIFIVLISFFCSSFSVFAQTTKVLEARNYLTTQNYQKAIGVINEAVANTETKNNAEAWFIRGLAYLQQALDTKANAPGAAGESYNSLVKALAIKPDYGVEINNALYTHALIAFNEGVASYTKQNFTAAYSQFMKVVAIYNTGNGKRFVDDRNFTELLINAKTNAAYAALGAKRDNDALVLLTDLKNSAGRKDSTIYQTIIEINERQNNETAALAAINEALVVFPGSRLFRNLELNHYIRSGRQDVLLTKLEAAIKDDPANGELLFNLGNIYELAAFPKSATGAALDRPANFQELFSKSEEAYTRAVAASPGNADYRYNLGVLYYELSSDITRQLNNIQGTSPEENKRYDALLADRATWFAKALPHFEKAYQLLDQHSAVLTPEEKVTYRNTMTGMREIYARSNNKAKADELQVKLDGLKN